MRRRVLDVLKMTEISGVDRPCQEGARVTIMKRAPDTFDELSARLAKIKAQVEATRVNKFWSVAARLAALEVRRRLAGGGARSAATRIAHSVTFGEARRRIKRAVAHAAAGAAVGAAAHHFLPGKKKREDFFHNKKGHSK